MILSIQYLRAIACVMILLAHTLTKFNQIYGDETPYLWPSGGSSGIDIFFIVSGFIITHVAWRHHQEAGYMRSFLWKRFFRIVPLYWFWTTVALMVFLVAPGQVNSSGGHTSVFQSYFFVPTDQKYLVQNGWSLSYELYFYATFALSLFAPRRVAYVLITALFVSAYTLGQSIHFHSPLSQFLTDGLLLEFLAGIGIYGLYRHNRVLPAPVAVGAVLGGFLEIFAFNLIGTTNPLLYHAIPAACIVYGTVSLEPWIRKCRIPLIETLGNASYSLYITHPFVLKAIGLVVAGAGLHGDLPYHLAGVVMLIASCTFGWLSYVAIEVPLQKKVLPFCTRHAAAFQLSRLQRQGARARA